MRPSRTREEKAQKNIYMNEQDLVKEYEKQAGEKRKMKQMQELQEKEDTLNHYKNFNIGGNAINHPETLEILQKLKMEEDQLNQLKLELENKDPDFFMKFKDEQMQKQRKDKVEQYHKMHQENSDPNEFMFMKDPQTGQQLSKGEIERLKRIQLRDQERQRRLLGQESSAYEQQSKEQQLSLPFQLEKQINGANEDERKQKRLNDLFDGPAESPKINLPPIHHDNDEAFRQTQSNFHQNKVNNFNNYDNFDNNPQSQNQLQNPHSNNQQQRKNLDYQEDTDIFGNKKAKKMIKADQINKPIENVFQMDQQDYSQQNNQNGGNQYPNQNGGYQQSPQNNNMYKQNTQKLQQNFSNNRRNSYNEQQHDDGKLPSINNNNSRKSINELPRQQEQQNQNGNSNIFGAGSNQVDSKKEKMLKYRQELDQQKEMKNQIGYSIKPYSAQQERRGKQNMQGSPSSGLPPTGNQNRDGFFDKFGQDPMFKKNLQNWEQQQFKIMNNADQFKPYSAQASRNNDNKYTPNNPSQNQNSQEVNNNNNNFMDGFGQGNKLRRPQSYQNIDNAKKNDRMSKQEYADELMKQMKEKNKKEDNRNIRNNQNNNSYQQINRSLDNLDDNQQHGMGQYQDNNMRNDPYFNQQQQNQPAGGLFVSHEDEQKQRNRERQRQLQKDLEEQIKMKQQLKEDEKRKEKQNDLKYVNQETVQSPKVQQFESQRPQQQNYIAKKSFDYDKYSPKDQQSGNNDQQKYQYDNPPPQSPSQQQQQQQQPASFARHQVLQNEAVNRSDQQKAIEAKKKYAEELNRQKQEVEEKKKEEKRKKQEQDMQEEMKVKQQIEEEKRKQEEEEQKKNRKKQEVDDFNKKQKEISDAAAGKQEKGKQEKNFEQNNFEQPSPKYANNNNQKPNFHYKQNQQENEEDQYQNQNKYLNRNDFMNNQSAQGQNQNYQQNPYQYDQFDNQQQMYQNQQQNQQQQQMPQMFPNQYQGMVGNMLNSQNLHYQMMNMNQMMQQPQFDPSYQQQQMLFQHTQMKQQLQMMQMDHQYFPQMMSMYPNWNPFLLNKQEIDLQRQLMEEKLLVKQFALQEQNLIDEYRNRLQKAQEEKVQFQKEIVRIQNELETKYGEKVNLSLFSEVIMNENERNKQNQLDQYNQLKQSIQNFKQNAHYLDNIQKKISTSNFYQNNSQKPMVQDQNGRINTDPNNKMNQNNQYQKMNLQSQNRPGHIVGVDDSNNSLYNQIKKIDDKQVNYISPSQPFNNSQINFEGTLPCQTNYENISVFDESYMRDLEDFEQMKQNQENYNEQYNSNSKLNSSSKNRDNQNMQNMNKKIENSNLLQIPDSKNYSASNAQIQQSFMQKTYQSQMTQSQNPSMNMNSIQQSQQNQQQNSKSTIHQTSQATNAIINNPDSVIEELPRLEEMDDSSKNHNDKSLSINQKSYSQKSGQQNQNRGKYHNFDRQNLMINDSDFVEEQKNNNIKKKKNHVEFEKTEDQDQFYSYVNVQDDQNEEKNNSNDYYQQQTEESQLQMQSQLINLELKKTAEYHKLFKEHFAQEDENESHFSKDDRDDDTNGNFNDRQKKKEEIKQDDYEDDEFENDGYEVNKYINKAEQPEEETIVQTIITETNKFDDQFHFDTDQKRKLKQAIEEMNKNTNDLGQQANTNKENSPSTNRNLNNQKEFKNFKEEVSYQQIQQNLNETVNVPKKEKEDDGLGQTQISEIHSTLKDTDLDKKCPANIFKLLRQHTDILNNSQNLEDNRQNLTKNSPQNSKNSPTKQLSSGQKNSYNSRAPAAPKKDSNAPTEQKIDTKRPQHDLNWNMQMIDEKSHKFQSQNWNQNTKKQKNTQNKIEDEIPEDMDFTQQQEIEMKEAEFNNQEQSLALPEDDIDKEKIGQFIESSCGYKNHPKLEDPEDQQTMQSEDFENNDDFQRHLQLNMIKNLNNQMKEQKSSNIQAKNIKIRPLSANQPIIGHLNQNRQTQNSSNSTANPLLQHNNSNLTTYSTQNNNNNNNTNITNNQDRRSAGFKTPKTIDVFGKIVTPKNLIPNNLEQSSAKSKGQAIQLQEESQLSEIQHPLFQYKGSNISEEQSQQLSNLNNNNNPVNKMVSMTRMEDQTGIYNNLVNPSSILQEEESYQVGGKNSSQPSFLRNDITVTSKQSKQMQSVQQQPKKSDMILNRLENLIYNLENSTEQHTYKDHEEQHVQKDSAYRPNFNKK